MLLWNLHSETLCLIRNDKLDLFLKIGAGLLIPKFFMSDYPLHTRFIQRFFSSGSAAQERAKSKPLFLQKTLDEHAQDFIDAPLRTVLFNDLSTVKNAVLSLRISALLKESAISPNRSKV
ncbi:hypothetical protein JQM68_04655 [Oscillibacter valericigenes]|uniref:hypothetical protein n=1 Tax=Oscillibacter valericigenes TaxID=351091 RepID=UPI001F3871C0|nr:hypothetical protein [Oscillibacter valericigenes]MCF2616482.1 hypothetical protein [Oscillibacter valericigenes]